MINSIAGFDFKKTLSRIDWKLLLFLLLFLNVKLAVKIPAIVIIYLLQFNFKFGFSFKNSRLPLFYLLIIIIASVDIFINKSYESPYYFGVFFNGVFFWILCILAIHQIKLSVENNPVEIIQRTILAFFVINAIVSLVIIARIMLATHTFNPYQYQGGHQKYFISTGDYIKGLTFDTSTTNAVINAFGVIYFLVRKNAVMVLVCMAVLLLTGSNFMNLTLVMVLALLFLFKSSKNQKSLIVICLMFLVVFMAKISPQNVRYSGEIFKNIFHTPKSIVPQITSVNKTDSITGPDAIRRKIATHYLDSVYVIISKRRKKEPDPYSAIPLRKTDQGRIYMIGENINLPLYQPAKDTSAERRKLLAFIYNNRIKLPMSAQTTFKSDLPGKAAGLLQTVKFMQHNPTKIITGDGMGNFSSKLAFKATGLGFAGGYPAKFAYISNDFFFNHLDLYLNFFSKQAGLHSLTNSPYSVYDQLLAEYGLLGLLVFVIFYLGFFTRHLKKLTYGIPLLMLMMAAFFIDYWFEQLSVIVLFELLLLLNIKETTYPQPVNYEHK
jgi:hypothetical protein